MDGIYTVIDSIVGSIILSVTGNLLTDSVKIWIDRRALVSKTKRKDALRKELMFVSELSQDLQKLNIELVGYNLRASLFVFSGTFGRVGGHSLFSNDGTRENDIPT
jgi:hypothetical protein